MLDRRRHDPWTYARIFSGVGLFLGCSALLLHALFYAAKSDGVCIMVGRFLFVTLAGGFVVTLTSFLIVYVAELWAQWKKESENRRWIQSLPFRDKRRIIRNTRKMEPTWTRRKYNRFFRIVEATNEEIGL